MTSSDVVQMVEYQLIRPSGELIYRYLFPSNWQVAGDAFAPNRAGNIWIGGVRVPPPWIGRSRIVRDGEEWTTLFERLTP